MDTTGYPGRMRSWIRTPQGIEERVLGLILEKGQCLSAAQAVQILIILLSGPGLPVYLSI